MQRQQQQTFYWDPSSKGSPGPGHSSDSAGRHPDLSAHRTGIERLSLKRLSTSGREEQQQQQQQQQQSGKMSAGEGRAAARFSSLLVDPGATPQGRSINRIWVRWARSGRVRTWLFNLTIHAGSEGLSGEGAGMGWIDA
jgi:hypothetical protein